MMPPVSQNQAATSELTSRIGRVARRELALNGYTRYEQLAQVTAERLLAIHGVGPKAVRILDEELSARGQAFAKGKTVRTR
jgi:predicted flap endonuclease-1-like 5' DNA nuclease